MHVNIRYEELGGRLFSENTEVMNQINYQILKLILFTYLYSNVPAFILIWGGGGGG